jgi:hypothetical protein
MSVHKYRNRQFSAVKRKYTCCYCLFVHNCGTVHDKDLRNLYRIPGIIRIPVVKSRRLRWVEHVVIMGYRLENAHLKDLEGDRRMMLSFIFGRFVLRIACGWNWPSIVTSGVLCYLWC